MRSISKFALAALLTLASGVTAQAADLLTVPTSTGNDVPVVDESTFDWNGFYAGVFGAGQFSDEQGSQYGLGLDIGANARFDFVLLGGEIAVEGLTGDDGTVYGQALLRAGVLATDNVLLYAAGGYGLDLGAPDDSDALVGGGVELAVTDDVSLRAQYLHGFPITGDNSKDQVTVGANFHF
jgi:outer membrane immunogenic protein